MSLHVYALALADLDRREYSNGADFEDDPDSRGKSRSKRDALALGCCCCARLSFPTIISWMTGSSELPDGFVRPWIC